MFTPQYCKTVELLAPQKTLRTNEYVHTFQVIDRFFQFGHRPLCKLCTGLGLINTIRVLKELKKDIRYEKGQLIFDLVSFIDFFTSFSLSLRTLISSSYLSSFSEYWNKDRYSKSISLSCQHWINFVSLSELLCCENFNHKSIITMFQFQSNYQTLKLSDDYYRGLKLWLNINR